MNGRKLKGRILLVDDNFNDRYWYGNLLQEAGYEVEVAEGWGKSLDKINQIQPDLIITELAMPDRDEITTLFELMFYSYADIPVVIHTGHSSKTITCGAQGYVKKSPDCKPLIEEVQKIIGKSH